MDLQEILKKQQARGFKKPVASTSNTLSINDYLSDPHASRPYIDDVSTTKPLSVVKNTNEEIRPVEIKSQPTSITEASDLTSAVTELNTTSKTAECEKAINHDSIVTTESIFIEIAPVKLPAISGTKAAQTAAKKLKNNHSKAGRPKFTIFDYASLVGNELNIINEIYSECLKSKSFETNFLEKNEFSQRVKVKPGAIRNSCRRLRKKSVLEDFITTKGRGSAWK